MNVLLISLDTTRADRLSCYGHNRPTSPNLDRIAGEGTLFTEFISPHIPTYPGHTTMMSGRDLYSHGITGQSGTPEPPPDIPLLAEIFKSNDWYTAAADNLGRWFQRGFDHTEPYSWEKPQTGGWRKAEAVMDAAMRALDRAANQDRPFFLFCHFWDPHTPYLPPAPFSRMFYNGDEHDPANRSMDALWQFEPFRDYFHEWMPGVTDIEFPKAQYDAEVAYMDACLGQLFERLREHRLIDETLIVITADHGEELDEHCCWFDHHGLYQTITHIPLIVRLPGVVPSSGRLGGIAAMTDIAPTVCDLTGVRNVPVRWDGVSLRSRIEARKSGNTARANSGLERLHLTENTWMKKRAWMTAEWKLIAALEPDIHGLPEFELFDRVNDPIEQQNLASAMPDKVFEMTKELNEHVRDRCLTEGREDPLPIQHLPLKRIGKPTLHFTATSKTPPNPSDHKRPEGDFVGYERDPPV